jgi:hypothetical protein
MGQIEEGAVLICIGLIGIVGNLVAIPYFGSRIPRQKTFYMLLTCLSICDLVVVVSGLFLYGIPKVSDSYAIRTYYIIAPYVFPMFEIGCTGSIYFTVAISIERYFVVCRPFWYFAQSILPQVFIVPIYCFAVVYNIPKFFEIRAVVLQNNNTTVSETDLVNETTMVYDVQDTVVMINATNVQYIFEPTEMRKNVYYYGIYHIGCEMVFQFIAPLFILVVANISILTQLIKYNSGPPDVSIGEGINQGNTTTYQPPNQQRCRQKQVDRAKVTLAICKIFIFCHLFKWVLNIYELYMRCKNYTLSEEEIEKIIYETQWFDKVVTISNTLVVLNSSINFYVYVLKDVCTK